ncbi:unnamed protein product [Pieris brassicae]|uniref:RRM domain-containing protein n=1 Tax=Pieris brassicae TaxID=7116 RepID=A0A9P0TT75_PIEBR|nr:unnamed protein product [Pieris brassicae]
MSFPPRPPMVPYGIAPGVVTMQMPTHVMVGAYGSGTVAGRGALLPAPAAGAAGAKAARGARTHNGQSEGPPVTVFIGNISSRAPDAMMRALLSACGAVCSWKRVSTFGFCEFAGPAAALRCVRLLHDRPLAERALLARVDGKMQALVDTYKTEQRSRLVEGGAEGGADEYLDAKQRGLDDAVERKIAQIYRDYQDEINNYEILQKEEQISKTARVLEEADISEEKRDVIHREIGKFRESMKTDPSRVAARIRKLRSRARRGELRLRRSWAEAETESAAARPQEQRDQRGPAARRYASRRRAPFEEKDLTRPVRTSATGVRVCDCAVKELERSPARSWGLV